MAGTQTAHHLPLLRDGHEPQRRYAADEPGVWIPRDVCRADPVPDATTDFRRTKMYKFHITAWGIRKNNRLHEARALLRRKHALDSQGFSSVFIVRGQLVNFQDIERCCKRAKERASDHVSDESERLPEGTEVVILRNQVGAIAAPEKYRILQSFLHHTAVYADSCFDRGTWRSFSDDEDLTSYPQGDENLAKICFDNLGYASACFGTGQTQLGIAYAQWAFAEFPKTLQSNHQDVIPNLLVQLQRIQRKGLNGLLDAVLRSLTESAVLTLPPSHPHEQTLIALRNLAAESLQSVYEVYIALMRSLYARKLGKNHFRVVRTDFLPSRGKDLTTTPWEEIQEATAYADDQYGVCSRRAFQILRSYCYRLYRAERWLEATPLFEELARRADKTGHHNTHLSSLFRLGKIHQQRGNSEDAKVYWLELFRIIGQDVDVFRYWGPELLEELEKVCRERGEAEEAEQYKAQLAGYHHAIVEADEYRVKPDTVVVSSSASKHPAGDIELTPTFSAERPPASWNDVPLTMNRNSFTGQRLLNAGWEKDARSCLGNPALCDAAPLGSARRTELFRRDRDPLYGSFKREPPADAWQPTRVLASVPNHSTTSG